MQTRWPSHAARRQRSRQQLAAALEKIRTQAAVLAAVGRDEDSDDVNPEVVAQLKRMAPCIAAQIGAAAKGMSLHSDRRDAHSMRIAARRIFTAPSDDFTRTKHERMVESPRGGGQQKHFTCPGCHLLVGLSRESPTVQYQGNCKFQHEYDGEGGDFPGVQDCWDEICFARSQAEVQPNVLRAEAPFFTPLGYDEYMFTAPVVDEEQKENYDQCLALVSEQFSGDQGALSFEGTGNQEMIYNDSRLRCTKTLLAILQVFSRVQLQSALLKASDIIRKCSLLRVMHARNGGEHLGQAEVDREGQEEVVLMQNRSKCSADDKWQSMPLGHSLVVSHLKQLLLQRDCTNWQVGAGLSSGAVSENDRIHGEDCDCDNKVSAPDQARSKQQERKRLKQRARRQKQARFVADEGGDKFMEHGLEQKEWLPFELKFSDDEVKDKHIDENDTVRAEKPIETIAAKRTGGGFWNALLTVFGWNSSSEVSQVQSKSALRRARRRARKSHGSMVKTYSDDESWMD